MKKTVCLIVAFMLIFSSLMSVSAATRDDVMDVVKECMPDDYEDLYLDTTKNIFANVETTEAQNDKLIEIIKRFSSTLDLTKGHSVHNYHGAEVDYIYSIVDELCALLNVSYKIVPKDSGLLHEGDIKAIIYGQHGEVIGELDGDIVKRTDEPVKTRDYTGLYTSGALMLVAIALFFVKKRIAV